MTLSLFETIIQWLGGLLAYAALGVIFYGIWRGSQRKAGRTTGRTGSWLRSAWFYFITTGLFLGLSVIGWIPLAVGIEPPIRIVMLVIGSLLYIPGMLFVLWGRLTLGKNYFVSTGLGAQLFAGHQLVTSGPYAIVRHPMYAGLMLAALGSLLVYFTWTTLFFALFSPMLMKRARREEDALAEQFGQQWVEYCQRVPLILPRSKQN
jgi:protein-S-isoprenylcysteine O-methyltransferase Ste14